MKRTIRWTKVKCRYIDVCLWMRFGAMQLIHDSTCMVDSQSAPAEEQHASTSICTRGGAVQRIKAITAYNSRI
jgi:hypothetical protein